MITPDESIKIFDNAELTNRDPISAFNDLSAGMPSLFPKLEPKLQNYVDENPMAKPALQNDADKLNNMERLYGKLKVSWDKSDVGSDIGMDAKDIMFKDVFGIGNIQNKVQFNETLERIAKNDLKIQELSKYDRKDDGIAINALPAISSGIFQLFESIGDNPEFAVSGAGIGGALGFTGGLGFGAVPGAVGGFFTVPSMYQNFNVTAGNVYKEAWLDLSDEEAAKVDKKDVAHIALGVGAISSGIDLVSNILLTKGAKDAFVAGSVYKGMTASAIAQAVKKGIQNNSTLQALKLLGQNIATKLPTVVTEYGKYSAKMAATQAVPEMFQEVTEQLGTKMAKNQPITFDEFLDVTFSQETALAGIAAFGTGVSVDAGSYSLGKFKLFADSLGEKGAVGKDINANDEVQQATPEALLRASIERRKQELENAKSIITDINAIAESVSIKDTAIAKEIHKNLGGEQLFYVAKELILRLENKQAGFVEAFEKATGRPLVDESEYYSITVDKLVNLFKKDAEIASGISKTPGGPTLTDYDTFIKTFEANKKFADTLLTKLQRPDITPEETTQIRQEYTELQKSTNEAVFDLFSNVHRDSIIPENMQKSMSKADKDPFIQQGTQMRIDSAVQTLQEEHAREKFAVDLNKETLMEDKVNEIQNQLMTNERYKVEEIFDPSTPINETTLENIKKLNPKWKDKSNIEVQIELLSNQKTKSKNYSLFAFDPATLPEEYKNVPNSKRVQDKNAFVNGGLDWKYSDVVAEGVLGPGKKAEDLIAHLRKTHSKEEYLSTQMKLKERKALAESYEDVGSKHDDYLKSFEDKSKLLDKELNSLIEKNENDSEAERTRKKNLRKIIKNTGKRAKTTNELRYKSQGIIMKLKSAELIPSLFESNEIKFFKRSAEALADGDIFEYFRYRELAQLNILMAGDARFWADMIESKSMKVRRLAKKENMDVLYNAGPEYVEAFNNLRNAINGRPMSESQVQNVINLYKPYIDAGIVAAPTIEFIKPSDVKVQQGDLQVDQVVTMLNTMIDVHALARKAQQIMIDEKLLSDLDLQKQIEEATVNNPNFDINRIKELGKVDNTKLSLLRKIGKNSKDSLTGYKQMYQQAKTVIEKLNIFKATGLFYDLLTKKIEDQTNYQSKLKTVRKTFIEEKAKETIGIDKLQTISRDTIQIVELPNQLDRGFENGIVTVAEFLDMIAQYGSESGRKAVMIDLQISEQQYTDIITKYATPEMLRFVESIHGYYKNEIWPEQQKRAKRLGLQPIAEVAALPYTINGKEYTGGYIPLRRKSDISKITQAHVTEDWMSLYKNGTIGKNLLSPFETFDASLIERTESTDQIDYTFESLIFRMDQTIHNLAFSEVFADIATIFSNKKNIQNIVGVVGVDDFATLVSSLEYLAKGHNDVDTYTQIVMAPSAKILKQTFNEVNKNLHSAYMGFGIMTLARQFKQIPSIAGEIALIYKGPKNDLNFAKVLKTQVLEIFTNPRSLFKQIGAIASQDSQMANYYEKLSQSVIFSKMLKLDKTLDMSKIAQGPIYYHYDNLRNVALHPVGFIQLILNTATWKTVYAMALDGRVEGIKAGDKQAAASFAGTFVRKVYSDDSPFGQSSIQRDPTLAKAFMFGQGQMNLSTNRAIAHMNTIRSKTGTDINRSEQLTKAKIAAGLNIILLTAGVVAMDEFGHILARTVLGADEAEEKENVDALGMGAEQKAQAGMGLKFVNSLLDLSPATRTFSYMLQRVGESGKDPQDIQGGNVFTQLGVDVAQTGTSLIMHGLGIRELSRQDYGVGLRLATNLVGLPSVNLPPSAGNPYGKSLRNIGIDNAVELLFPQAPIRYDKEISFIKDSEEFFTGYDNSTEEDTAASENITTATPNYQPDQPATQREIVAATFEDAVDKLNTIKDLTPDEKNYLSGVRDIMYSVNGVTNSEGDIITTKKGVVDVLDHATRSKYTIWIETFSRFETNNHQDFDNPKSTAKGYFHFLQGTWNGMRTRYPELGLPATVDLASKAQQYQAYWKLFGENLIDLQELNSEITPYNMYMIHVLGRGDYKTFINADEDQDLSSVLPKVFEDNPGLMNPGTRKKILDRLPIKMDVSYDNAIQFLNDEKLLTP